MLGFTKTILLIMDIIVGVIGFFANCLLLYFFASVNPHVSHEDYCLVNAFLIIYLGFDFLAGLVMMCSLDGFKYLIKCNASFKNIFATFCHLMYFFFGNLLIIILFGYFAQVIYKIKEIRRKDEDKKEKMWWVFSSVALFCTFA